MSKIKKTCIVFLSSCLLLACGSNKQTPADGQQAAAEKPKKSKGLSDERISSLIASSFGVKESDFKISDKTYAHPRTNFTLTMKNGNEYVCYIYGGGFLTMGATVAPVCNKKGEIPTGNRSPLQ